jgi:archaeal type IV pilus assembly protein PilA
MNFSLKQKKRSAVSPVIATLLLIAIAVAAAIIVYAFVTGLIGGLSGSATSNLVTLTGSISVPNGTGAGVAVLTLRNSANSPVTSVIVTGITPSTGSMASIASSSVYPGIVVSYNGGAVTPTNAIPIGSTASGAYSFGTGGTAGSGYTLTVTITFSNLSTQIQTLDVTGQI